MSDESRRRPPRPVRPEPTQIITGDVSGQHVMRGLPTSELAEYRQKLDEVTLNQEAMLGQQRKLGEQLDVMAEAIERRLTQLGQQLTALQTTVLADHAPRLTEVEKTTGEKAKSAALKGTKYTAYVTLGVLVLRGLGKVIPELGAIIDPILDGIGL